MSRLTDHYQCYLEKSVNPSRENLTPRAANQELSDQSRDSPSDQLRAPHRNSIKIIFFVNKKYKILFIFYWRSEFRTKKFLWSFILRKMSLNLISSEPSENWFLYF